VLPGLDEAVREMDPGEKRTVELSPEQAYGHHDEDQVVTLPRSEIEARSETEAAEGELVTTDTGESGWITAVTEDTVEIDFNHELAGETLECDIHLLEVR
jgi:peptidylprolyl isomerase